MKSFKFLFVLTLISAFICNHAAAQTDKKEPADTVVFTKVEVAASYPGGIDGWRRYLEGNLKYPTKAVRKKIQGVVRVEMTVDKNGNVTNVSAQNDPGGGLADEAVRVVKDGPRWIPATQDGKKVTYRFIQTITFLLN